MICNSELPSVEPLCYYICHHSETMTRYASCHPWGHPTAKAYQIQNRWCHNKLDLNKHWGLAHS